MLVMSYDVGPQYPKDRQLDPSGFLAAARMHQSKFRSERLCRPFVRYGNFLTAEDAKAGWNFYPGFSVFDAARKRYPRFSEKVYGNMLRSEHIPLNLFHPLNADDVFRLKVFSTLLGRALHTVSPVAIEHAPPRAEALNDGSSFDAYMEYQDNGGSNGLLGIEVKYTERAYPLKHGSKEEREINDRNTSYFRVMSFSGIYRPDCEAAMITDEYRQIWRNQLLAESILQRHPARFAEATLMMVHPSANTHMRDACQGYSTYLLEADRKFKAVTYERFIEVCRDHAETLDQTQWLDYLQERYIVEQ